MVRRLASIARRIRRLTLVGGLSSALCDANHEGASTRRTTLRVASFTTISISPRTMQKLPTLRDALSRQKWIVSYDNVVAIRSLYANVRHVTYDIGYSARSARKGSEVMFFCDGLKVPPSWVLSVCPPISRRFHSA